MEIKEFIGRLDKWQDKNLMFTITLVIPITFMIAGLMLWRTLVSSIIAVILITLCILFIYPSWRHWLFSSYLKRRIE